MFPGHLVTALFNFGQAGFDGGIVLALKIIQPLSHGACNLFPGFVYGWQGRLIGELASGFLGLDAHPFGNGEDLAPMIQCHKTPAVTTRQRVAVFFEGSLKSCLVVTGRPAILKNLLDGFGVFANTFGLLPLGQSEVSRVGEKGPGSIYLIYSEGQFDLPFFPV